MKIRLEGYSGPDSGGRMIFGIAHSSSNGQKLKNPELIFGYISGSIALVADSFHMLSDIASLVIALVASKLTKRKTVGPEYTFGLQRAEVVGALINGCSLLALCFSLVIQAIQRFIEPEEIKNPWVVFWVAIGGLVINLGGMVLFHEHSHAGHSHGHSHNHKEHKEIHHPKPLSLDNPDDPTNLGATVIRVASIMSKHRNQDQLMIPMEEIPVLGEETDSPHRHDHTDLNMHGVFLHIMGDMLGSLSVIASTLIVIFCQGNWTLYVDPAISILITLILVYSGIPLVKSAVAILLQGTPSSISVDTLRHDIMAIPDVLDVHELHVWQLSDTQIIASVHVVVPHPRDADLELLNPKETELRYMELAALVKQKLHVHGIHSTTIQPEYVTDAATIILDRSSCMLRCTSKECATMTCCPPQNHDE